LGPIPNPQSPIPNPQSPIVIEKNLVKIINQKNKYKKIINYNLKIIIF
jgi:hypothetical protein